jgi:hypothetical protein
MPLIVDAVSNLFLRTISQGLQAFVPIAVALAWFRHCGDGARISGIHRGLLLSAPATVLASWWFQRTPHRALDEAALATCAVAIAGLFAVSVRCERFALGGCTRQGFTSVASAARSSSVVNLTIIAATALIVVRQTMEIGSVLETAAFALRSYDATAAVVQGVAVSGVTAWLVTWTARRLPETGIRAATRAFSLLFLMQVIVYAFHESAEARLLPWSEVLHLATEPYGPDGVYGIHFSDLLVIGPGLAAAWTIGRSSGARLPGRRHLPARPRLATATLIAASFILIGMQRTDTRTPRPAAGAGAAEIAAVAARPHVFFRDTAPGGTFGRLGLASLSAPGVRLPTAVSCDRISFAGGRGLCLHTERGLFNTYSAVLLDDQLKPAGTIKLQGLPSRTRVTADGKVGAITVFVLGDDYASDSFSTRTTLIDLSSGDEIGELEQFVTWRAGTRIRAADFNFWGVTFARDGTTFYASLRTAGKTYLVRGELALRKLTVVRDNVECPSLSPDNRLLAYKKRVGPSPDAWRLHVLDLASDSEQMISAETRYIDDQVEWLDPQHVLYAVPRRTTAISDVWVVPIDSSAPPRIFLEQAESPSVVR